MPEYTLLVKGETSWRGEIGCYPRPILYFVPQLSEIGNDRGMPRHRVGKCVIKPLDQLEQRQVDVGNLFAKNIRAYMVGLSENAVEVTQELRQAFMTEHSAPFLRRLFLILIVK